MDNQIEAVEQKLKSLVLKNCSSRYMENDITDDLDLIENFNYDSISIIQLIIDIENNFEIQIEDDFLMMESISKYQILKNYIIDMISKQREA